MMAETCKAEKLQEILRSVRHGSLRNLTKYGLNCRGKDRYCAIELSEFSLSSRVVYTETWVPTTSYYL